MENFNPSAIIGDRIRARRKALGMNQSELAKAVGVSQSSITQYEGARRDMNANNLIKFASVLQVPISYFYSGIDTFETLNKSQSITFKSTVDLTNVITKWSEDTRNQMFDYPSIAKGADEEQFIGYFRKLTPAMQKTAMSLLASLCDNERQALASATAE